MTTSLLDCLLDLWRRCHFPLPTGLKLFSLRGLKVVAGQPVRVPERTDFFDDTLFLWDESRRYIDHVACTAGQPGWWWINHYAAGAGAPFTRCGCYAYVRGEHRGHAALRQEQSELGRLGVIRDVNRNGSPDFELASEDRFDYPLSTGINIHCCVGHPSHVGVWSSGCHVVQGDWAGPEWRRVHHAAYGSYAKQTRFWYGVVEGAWLWDRGQRLLLGSQGDAVRTLREYLGDRGMACGDGVRFGEGMDRAYRRWQRSQGRVQDGICTNPGWG